MDTPELTLVIPTYNERECVVPLIAALDQALGEIAWQAVFVDDSTDGTDDVIAAVAAEDGRVSLLHRAVNRGGLAGAVVDGLMSAQGQYVCVLDADLQHPPERIPAMLAAAREQGADVVVASRYIAGGSSGGLDGPMRQFYSRGLKRLSQFVFPRRLGRITDPLGGYFLLQRSITQGVELRPIGYKILLEILIRCRWHVAAEVPYRFQPRQYGASKADLRQGLRFLRHLGQLVWDCSPSCAPLRLATRLSPRERPAVAGSRL
jgi:glycosyltransferase involved in cell wall biosynthesis